MKLVFVSSLLSMQHKGERGKTGWLGSRITCLSGATCLSVHCYFNPIGAWTNGLPHSRWAWLALHYWCSYTSYWNLHVSNLKLNAIKVFFFYYIVPAVVLSFHNMSSVWINKILKKVILLFIKCFKIVYISLRKKDMYISLQMWNNQRNALFA
jgi:hypothetical protein